MRTRCKFGIHCYHPHKYEDRIELHGVFHEDKTITEMNYICCYCGYKNTDPTKYGPLFFFGTIERYYPHPKPK